MNKGDKVRAANATTRKWLAPDGAMLPDFIICGAMKSGTSTLHQILNAHPDICIPAGEVGFFDIDDAFQHPEYNIFLDDWWYRQEFEVNPDRYWEWYSDFFRGIAGNQVIGEDSTTYLASLNAAERISLQIKPIKLVVMLRHPTERAYSQYWHMLRYGLVSGTFEEVLERHPQQVIQRSLYAEQLERMFRFIPTERVCVLQFEELLAAPEFATAMIAEFLGVDGSKFPQWVEKVHENQARVPKYIWLALLRNRFLGANRRLMPRNNLPFQYPVDASVSKRGLMLLHKLHKRINPIVQGSPPAMHPRTREMLDVLLYRENSKLNNIIGRDVLSRWFSAS